MTDPRVVEAQRLYWEIRRLRELNAEQRTLPKLRKMAALHKDRGLELARCGDPDGWIDIWAAITAYGEAGEHDAAKKLIGESHALCDQNFSSASSIHEQLTELDDWLANTITMPSLGDFGDPLPMRRVA